MKLLRNTGISEFWLNVSKLAGGTIAAQLAGILLSPVIMRIFDARDIGLLNLFNQLVGLFLVVSVLRLDRAVVLANEADTRKIIQAGNTLIVFFTSVLILVFLPFSQFWFSLWNLRYPSYFISAIPLAFLLQSTINLYKAGSNSFQLYGFMAGAIALQSFLVNILKIIFGVSLGAGPAFLILAEIAAAAVAALLLWYALSRKSDYRFALLPISDLREVLFREQKFMKYDVPAALLNVGSMSVVSFLLAYFFDTPTVGYYALGFTMLRLPMNLLGKAIGDVFYKSSAMDADNPEVLRGSASRVVVMLFSFGILPTLLVFFFGDVLFSFFFGKGWIPAGEISSILSFFTLIWFISAPISNLYYVLQKHHRFLQVMFSSLVLRAASITVGAFFFDIYGTIILFSITSSLVYGYQVIFLLKCLRVSASGLIKNLIKSSLFTLPAIVVMAVINYISPATPVMMAIVFPVIGISMAFRWFRKPKLAF